MNNTNNTIQYTVPPDLIIPKSSNSLDKNNPEARWREGGGGDGRERRKCEREEMGERKRERRRDMYKETKIKRS